MFPFNYMANITLTLYKMVCSRDEVVKKLADGQNDTITIPLAYLLDSTSILEPVFKLANTGDIGSDTVGYWRKFNYLHCPNLGRWYYINDIIYLSGGIVELHCTCDVLMTYSDIILNSTQVVDRSEKLQSPLLIDDQMPFNNGTYTEIYNLKTPYYSNHTTYLLKLGGAYNG